MTRSRLPRIVTILTFACVSLLVNGCGLRLESENHARPASPTAPPGPLKAPVLNSEDLNKLMQKIDSPSTYSLTVNASSREGAAERFRHEDTGFNVTLPKEYGSREVFCDKGVACEDRYLRIGIDGDKDGSCAGVRIGKDLILTNRHCAEVVVTRPGKRFTGILSISVPGDKLRKKRMLWLSNLVMISPASQADRSPDWAILKISSLVKNLNPAGFPRSNRSGLKAGEIYTVLTMVANPKDRQDRLPLKITAQKCIGARPGIFFPAGVNSGDAVIGLSGCAIGPGDSGSPIYNSNDELVGIIAGQLRPDFLMMSGEIANMQGASVIATPRTFRDAGWGTSLACIPDVEHLKNKIPSSCGKETENAVTQVILPDGVEPKVRAALSIEPLPHPHLRYDTYRSNPLSSDKTVAIGQVSFVKAPYCISGAALGQITETPIKVPAIVSSVILDLDGVPTTEIGETKTNEAASLDFDLEKLKTTGESPSSLYAFEPDFVLYRGTIKICEDRK